MNKSYWNQWNIKSFLTLKPTELSKPILLSEGHQCWNKEKELKVNHSFATLSAPPREIIGNLLIGKIEKIIKR